MTGGMTDDGLKNNSINVPTETLKISPMFHGDKFR